ncbi:MAG TPA: response regulator [Thermodesulfobacteriota bacterium]|nr:response regulator [Thermodesulfobacteriota bacterium]
MKQKGRYAFILDKDEFVRLSLNKILNKYGFQVEEIEDFSQLENRKKEIDRGIIFADVEMNALEKWVSLVKKWNNHFVLMSPLITEELTLRLKKMGIHRIIKKPVEIRSLKRVIRELCPPEEGSLSSLGKGRKKGSRSIQKGGEQT